MAGSSKDFSCKPPSPSDGGCACTPNSPSSSGCIGGYKLGDVNLAEVQGPRDDFAKPSADDPILTLDTDDSMSGTDDNDSLQV